MLASDEDWVPRSLVHATDIDALPPDRVLERRDGYLVIRSPSNPAARNPTHEKRTDGGHVERAR